MSQATNAFVGKAYLAIGDGAEPEVFGRYCEVNSISGIGQKNALIDVTTFCSDGSMEYIGGLSDGNEVTFAGNYVTTGTDAVAQDKLITDVENKVTRNVTVTMGATGPGERVYTFSMAMLSWELTPSVSKQNEIKFTGKITGPIAVVTTT